MLAIVLFQMISVLGEKRGNLVNVNPPIGTQAQELAQHAGKAELLQATFTSVAAESLCAAYTELEDVLQNGLDKYPPEVPESLMKALEQSTYQNMKRVLADTFSLESPIVLYESESGMSVYATHAWMYEHYGITMAIRPSADTHIQINTKRLLEVARRLSTMRTGEMLATCAQKGFTTATRESIYTCIKMSAAEWSREFQMPFYGQELQQGDVYKITVNIPPAHGCEDKLVLSQTARILAQENIQIDVPM